MTIAGRHYGGVHRAWGFVALALFLVILGIGLPSHEPPTLDRGPYLQLLTEDSVMVVWRTAGPAACGLEVWRLAHPGVTRIDGDTSQDCAITVDGLLPGTQYVYVPLGDGTNLTSPSVFRTDDRALPYVFLVVGDSGSGKEEQFTVAGRMGESSADFTVHVGDMMQEDADPEQWDSNFFVPYRDLLRRLALWPCVGNHDVSEDDDSSWRDAVITPANNPAGDERYYSFDQGNAHVVVLDTYTSLDPHSAQYAFLVRDLGASVATWKFVVLHDTIYSSGFHHGSDLSIREDLVPVFDAYAVDIVFMGHDHHYERTKPLLADEIVAPGEGTVYVTTGGGGGVLRPVGESSFTAYAESVHHFVRVSVDGGTLLLEMVRDDGTIGDSMRLVKQVPMELSVSPVADTYIEAGEAELWVHGACKDLLVDAEPQRITYLKFDLREVAGSIRSAALTLFPEDNSDDGGTAYPVLDSTWVEGVGDESCGGSGGGSGLTWADVDTDGDGMITGDDTSPHVPDFSRLVAVLGPVIDGEPITADVTAAFPDGAPGVYTLAISNQAANGVRYTAQESLKMNRQPALHLELWPGMCGDGYVQPGEQCDDISCCTNCLADPPGTPCKGDGLFCTGVETCDGWGACVSSRRPCTDGPECADACSEASDSCFDPAGTPCTDDGLFCTGVETCDGWGACVSSRGPCTDGPECADTCNEASDSCFDAAGTPCTDDGLFCTDDQCDGAGTCLHVTRVDCPIVMDLKAKARQSDCYAVFAGVSPTRGPWAECTDGDAACDLDGMADGTCTFEVAVCVLQTDMPGCRPTAVGGLTIEQILTQPKRLQLQVPLLPASAPACGPRNLVRVPLEKPGKKATKLGLKLVAVSNGRPKKDIDKVHLRCMPGDAVAQTY